MLVGELFARLGLDKREYDKGVDDAKQGLQGVEQQASKSSGFIGQAFAKAGGLLKAGLLGGVGLLAGGLIGASAAGLGFNNQMEQVTAKLNAFTKDGAKTADILAMIKDRAAKTPFEFGQMADAAASLLPVSKASGVALEDLISQAEILAASNPMQGLEGAAYALKQAASGDLASVIDRFDLPRQRLNELKEQGVPALQAVQIAMQEMGLDAALVANLGETASGRWSTFKDTLVGLAATATQPIFDTFSNGLGQVNGYLEASGPLLQRAAELVAGALGQGVTWVAGTAIPGLIAGVQSLQPIFALVANLFKGAGDQSGLLGTALNVLGGVWDALKGLIAAVAPSIQSIVLTVFNVIGGFLKAHGSEIGAILKLAWETIGLLIQAAVALVQATVVPAFKAVASFLANHKTEITALLSAAWTIISSLITAALGVIQGVIKTVLSVIKGDWSGAWEGIKQIVSSVWDGIKGVVGGAVDGLKVTLALAWDAIKGTARSAWDGIASAIGSAFSAVVGSIEKTLNRIKSLINRAIDGFNNLSGAVGGPTIPHLAKGTRFFQGGMAMVGEVGPELVYLPRGSQVVPHTETRRLLAGGGGGPTVVNNYNLTAQYGYQEERSLRDDVRMFQLLGGMV